MIVSFHPCFEADQNLICAGRPPGSSDLKAIKAADAVVLSQGCSDQLYHMARENCPHIFPNLDAKFDYPGKIGQIKLFETYRAPHPKTDIFESSHHFQKKKSHGKLHWPYPHVLKLNWGGEGEGVFFVDSDDTMQAALARVSAFENSGNSGFLIQKYIPCGSRSLRVVVIGERYLSYWRVQKQKKAFFTHISKGAIIDHAADPDLQTAGIAAAKALCRKSGINLAGFDFLFSEDQEIHLPKPLFLEINYFFGRSGIGGSDAFYHLLTEEIETWLNTLKLKK